MKKIVKARDLIRFKVALIGDAMVGKTCLVENYTGVTTIGRCCDLAINFSELNIPLRSKIIKLIFNDLCGFSKFLIIFGNFGHILDIFTN